MNDNQETNNNWQSWATGKVAMTILGIAVGMYIYNSGIIGQLTGKLFKKEEN